jgi:hypothetical protein
LTVTIAPEIKLVVPIPTPPVGEIIRFPEGEREVMSELAPEAAAPKSALAEAAEEAPVPPSDTGIGTRDSVGGVADGLVQARTVLKTLNPPTIDR